jgi:hypothetical protein
VKKSILVVSMIMLVSLISCGKKAPPLPKGVAPAVAVGDFRGEVRDGVLFLSFVMPPGKVDSTEPKGLAGFKALRSCTGCRGGLEPWREVRLTDKTGYTIYNGRLYFYDDDLRQGQDYVYQVIPYTDKGIVGASSNIYSIKWELTPKPPKRVSAKAEDRRVDLSWSEEQGVLYNVYRFDDDTYPIEPLNKLILSVTLFTDRTVQNGKRYKYEVRSVRPAGTMRWEGEGTAVEAIPQDKTAPAPPHSLKAVKKEGSVMISWEKNAEEDFLGYAVYRIGMGGPEKLNKEPLRDAEFVDTTVPGTLRYVSYYVTAVDRAGNESGPSRELIIMLKE